MTIGVGGSSREEVLESLTSMRGDAPSITDTERRERIARAQQIMRDRGIEALYLDASTSFVLLLRCSILGKRTIAWSHTAGGMGS